MNDLETLRVLEDGRVATITLARPAHGNRINVTFLKEFQRVCHHLEDHSTAPVVVLRADGPDFSLGIDFRDFAVDRPIDIHGFAKWEKLVTLLERLPKATLAALHGRVEGGGLQLAMVCDQRIALPGTTLRLPEVQMGFLPGMATFRLAKYIGLGRARRLMLTARAVAADEGVSLGLLDEVVSDLDVGIDATIASFGPIHPVAIEMARRLLSESFHDSHEDAVGHFLAAQHRCVMQSAFLETLRTSRGE
jgi:enoyl-CoA hydratase/carnithine racemase